MGIIYDLFKGLIALSVFALIQNGGSVKQMAEKAMNIHKQGLSSYKSYSKKLTKPKPKIRSPREKQTLHE